MDSGLGTRYVYERMHVYGLCRDVKRQLVGMGCCFWMEYTVRIYVAFYCFIFSYVLQIVG